MRPDSSTSSIRRLCRNTLFAPSNEVWNIGDRIFAPILVQLHALTAIQQLQRYAIVFRKVFASNQRAVVKEATYIPLICYENFMWTKKQPAIFSGVVGRSSRLTYAQQESERFRMELATYRFSNGCNKAAPVLAFTTSA